MFFPHGKEVLQMDEYMMMHADTAWQFLQEHTFWQMLGFQHVLVSSYLSNENVTTSKSGLEHPKGLSCLFLHMVLADCWSKATKCS
jgi:hypothetical protein